MSEIKVSSIYLNRDKLLSYQGDSSNFKDEKINNLLQSIEAKLKDSKNFYKKVKKLVIKYEEKNTPHSIFNLISSLGCISFSIRTGSSGSFDFHETQKVYKISNRENIEFNPAKRRLKQINSEIKSLYQKIDSLNKEKEKLSKI